MEGRDEAHIGSEHSCLERTEETWKLYERSASRINEDLNYEE
jgi:hypothetical protein